MLHSDWHSDVLATTRMAVQAVRMTRVMNMFRRGYIMEDDGWAALLKICIGVFMYVYRSAGYDTISPVYTQKYPFCDANEKEDAWHLLWACCKWTESKRHLLG